VGGAERRSGGARQPRGRQGGGWDRGAAAATAVGEGGGEGGAGADWEAWVGGADVSFCFGEGGSRGWLGAYASSDPMRFCEYLLARCRAKGVVVHQPAEVVGVLRGEESKINGLELLERSAEGSAVVHGIPASRVFNGAWLADNHSCLHKHSSVRRRVDS
jgi:hypothetical protein